MAGKALRRLAPDLARLELMEVARLEQIRLSLVAFSVRLPPQKRVIVQAVLYNLRQITQTVRTNYRDAHELSDHAFVRVLERGLGLDITELKDKAMATIRETGLEPQYSFDGKTIMTVLPRREGRPENRQRALPSFPFSPTA
jgi:hypothetical protein